MIEPLRVQLHVHATASRSRSHGPAPSVLTGAGGVPRPAPRAPCAAGGVAPAGACCAVLVCPCEYDEEPSATIHTCRNRSEYIFNESAPDSDPLAATRNCDILYAMKAIAASFVALVATLSPLIAQSQKPIALVGGTLIDGTGVPRPGQRGSHSRRSHRANRYADIAACPGGYERVSTEGMTVLPGLWDLHVHLIYSGHPNPGVVQARR